MTTKFCTKCGEEKDVEEFLWSIRGIKRHSRCRKCHAADKADYYERNKEKMLEYKWERQQRKREEARKFVWEHLSSRVCSDCGEYDPMVLTFDHVRGTKKMNVSQMVSQGYSLKAIQDEIDKCECVCSNCHMRREKKRRNTKYW